MQILQPLNSPKEITINLSSSLFDPDSPIQFRFLRSGDQDEVKLLCRDWFPIEYPDKWYDDISNEGKYYALAACVYNRIIGLIVADNLQLSHCNKEDQTILNKSFSLTTQVCYILILGVVKEYRRHGLAGHLLSHLLNYLHSRSVCKAVYLHVLCTNRSAIKFYESKQFQYRLYLPYYYSIRGQPYDGYCYVLYINGGQPPYSTLDYINTLWRYLLKTNPCKFLYSIGYWCESRLNYDISNCNNDTRAVIGYKSISRII
ncbi:unnamed protein product [Didymodactylos carnosus]|uniref:N-alpha-acetyltransferase 60 n=1 Tax=Didymodactylos carnosus TaxID=1234261 RepID=A0A813V3R5_9BILA|nr:unnamed protein product [Didymodactylos carnosus]CAF1033746.1 unnamed protein product [Didymodactylos carnosus]CAF3626671.1 unnamed protein product [Didymodactylos carnosus]CAF3802012.1 unnamed protein product [Didymodactylos carnosus]